MRFIAVFTIALLLPSAKLFSLFTIFDDLSLVGILLHFRAEIVYSRSSGQTKGEHSTLWSRSRNEERLVSIFRSNVPNAKLTSQPATLIHSGLLEASKFSQMQKSSEYVRFLSKRIHPMLLNVYCFLVLTDK